MGHATHFTPFQMGFAVGQAEQVLVAGFSQGVAPEQAVAAAPVQAKVTLFQTDGALQRTHFLVLGSKLAPPLQRHWAVAVSKRKPGGQQTHCLVGRL